MKPKLLNKLQLKSFLEKISDSYDVVAPVKTDILRFLEVKKEDFDSITLEGRALFSAKKYFYNSKHTLFKFKDGKIIENKFKGKRVIFGMRLCDINALLKLDKLFLDEFEDSYYKDARENTLILGINCEVVPNAHCFCESMDLRHEGYDLFFCDAGENFHIIVGSEKGEMLVKELPESDAASQPIRTEKKLLKKDISALYDNPSWKEATKKCISCGACTNLCPDCLCFDIMDDPGLDVKSDSGIRHIEWDSCQYKGFTEVAGGHVFRDSRENRLKHRIFHKLQYFKEKFGENMCTGCGRCIEGCPTKIDFVEIINNMQ